MHAGHVDYLQKARALCDRLVVAVNSDESIRQYKNPLRPINPAAERMAVVGALGCVDAVTSLDERRPIQHLLRWKPDVYIKGGDYETANLKSAADVIAYGGRVELIPVAHQTSTTTVIERILLSEAHEAPEPVERSVAGIVFLDRDGTLIPDLNFLHEPTMVSLLPEVGEGLAKLQALNLRLVVITNQQGIGLGYYTEQQFIKVNQAMMRLLTPYKVQIDRYLFCPHSHADDCDCRKPGALLLRKAMMRYGAQPENCFVIGDRSTDIEAADNAGCKGYLVGPGGLSFAGAVEQIQAELERVQA